MLAAIRGLSRRKRDSIQRKACCASTWTGHPSFSEGRAPASHSTRAEARHPCAPQVRRGAAAADEPFRARAGPHHRRSSVSPASADVASPAAPNSQQRTPSSSQPGMPSSSSQQQWYKRTGSFSGGGGGGGASASSALMSVGSASLRLVAGTISTGYSTISTAAAVASSAVGGATGTSGTDGASFSSDAKEKVLWARFDALEVADCASGGAPRAREVLLLGYAVGFQVWDVTDPGEVQELLSLRDVTVRCVQPLPAPLEPDPSSSPMKGQRPVLAVVPCSQTASASSGGAAAAGGGGGGGPSSSSGTIELHSAASQALVRILTFHSRVISVRASPRILAVALETQVLGFDASSLDKLFTAMTYPTPGSGPAPHEGHLWAAPLALGHRWLAYASNQPVKNPSGYATLQANAKAPPVSSSSAPGASNHHHHHHHHHPLSYSHHESFSHHRHSSAGGAGGGSGSSYSGYVKNVASQAAAASGKQLKAGISWVGDTSYKLLSSQYASWTAGSSSSSSFKRPSCDGGDFPDAPGMTGRSPDSFGGYFGATGGGGGGGPPSVDPLQAQVAGTVMVCDVMRRHTAVAHFRAHTSPLALLAWDPSGLLLVTASVYGHSVNVFQICPPAAAASSGGGGGGGGGPGGAMHLYKLSRGITPALITDAVFSCSGEWLAVSSGRGTTHLFHLGSEQQQQGGAAAAGHSQQQRPLMVSSAAAAPPPLQHLSPVGRLRSSRGWAARVPGAPLAAAAAGLYAGGPGTAGPSVGAIAARFTGSSSSPSGASPSGRKSGGGSYQGEVLLAHEQLQQQQQPQGSSSPPSSEELLIAGPEGTLTRYLVGLSCPDGAPGGSFQGAEADDEGMMFGSSPASMSSAFSMEGNDPDASELASEVVSRLDVCRRLAWPERGNLSSEALSMPSPHGKAASASAAAKGALPEFPRVADTEEERHSFVANAEICRHPAKAPLWAAAPQFHFLELQQQQQSSPVAGAVPSSGCVEEIPTRRVDVARGELLPSGAYWDPFMAPAAAAAIA